MFSKQTDDNKASANGTMRNCRVINDINRTERKNINF